MVHFISGNICLMNASSFLSNLLFFLVFNGWQTVLTAHLRGTTHGKDSARHVRK